MLLGESAQLDAVYGSLSVYFHFRDRVRGVVFRRAGPFDIGVFDENTLFRSYFRQVVVQFAENFGLFVHRVPGRRVSEDSGQGLLVAEQQPFVQRVAVNGFRGYAVLHRGDLLAVVAELRAEFVQHLVLAHLVEQVVVSVGLVVVNVIPDMRQRVAERPVQRSDRFQLRIGLFGQRFVGGRVVQGCQRVCFPIVFQIGSQQFQRQRFEFLRVPQRFVILLRQVFFEVDVVDQIRSLFSARRSRSAGCRRIFGRAVQIL